MEITYEIRKSTHSRNYFYIVRVENGQEIKISTPLTKKQLWGLKTNISETLGRTALPPYLFNADR